MPQENHPESPMSYTQDTTPTHTMSGVQARSCSLCPKCPSDFRPLLIIYRVSALHTMKVQVDASRRVCVGVSTYN